MAMLEAAMAFAVVMIILSTIATGVTELILRVLGLRQAGLRRALNRLYKDIIQPRLAPELADLARQSAEAGDTTRAPERFRRDMQRNPAARSHGTGFLNFFTGESRVDVLSVVAFAQRLGKTDVGQAVLAQGEEQIELLVQDFTRSFDRYATAAREAYRRNAQVWAMIVGILVAFAVNADAVRIYTTLADNPEIRQGLVNYADEAKKEYDDAQKKLNAALEEIQGENNDAKIASLIEDAKSAFRKPPEVEEFQLPIGWSYHPYCVGKTECSLNFED